MNAPERLARSARVGWLAATIMIGYRWLGWRNRRRTPEEAELKLANYHRRSAQRILELATNIQGLLIKVGQIIGTRADVFPDEYIEVLSQLHDAVPPHPYPVIRAVIERELGAPLEKTFAEFEVEPIAAASLAQVHRGRLHDGREVAVKVQYPEIEAIVKLDLQNIRLLVRVANRLLRDIDLTPIVDEMSANVPLELDFIHEGHNAEQTAQNFADRDDVIVPRIYWEHTTKRVLTMEFLDGIKITDMAAIDAAGIEKQAIARLLGQSYSRQIFAHGFFHADPHPGNLFVRPGPKLIIVDFGLAKQLPAGFVQGFTRLTGALVAANSTAVAQAFRDLGFRARHEDDTVFEAMGEAMVARLSKNGEFSQDRQMMIEFQERMMRVFRENPIVRVPGEFLLLGRVMGLLSGLSAQLGYQVNLLDIPDAELPQDVNSPR